MYEFEKKLNTFKAKHSDFEFLKTVMDVLPSPMSIKNSRLERIAVNQAFVEISGYSKDKLLGASKLDIQSAETKTSTDYDQQVLDTKKDNKHTEKIIDNQGQSRWVEIQKSYFQNQDGDAHVISVLTDITELKKREFELIDSKKKTYQKSIQRSRFLANMGHDIREPLRGIVGMTGLLRSSDLDIGQADAVSLLERASDALMRILDDVVDFAKIDAGLLTIHPESFDLYDLIEGIADILGLSARDKHIDLIVAIDPNLPSTFMGDTVRIRQILMNLIENALKFTTEGFVSINVSGHVRDNIAHLEFAVKDSGVGIPPAKLESLFKYVESDEKTQRISGVSGLGVSLCYRLARLMGGLLDASSVDGIGSEFKLILPLECKVAPETNQPVETLLENSARLTQRLLFVDDIKENYDAINPYLSAHGLTVDYAQSAAHAVNLLNNALLAGRPYTVIFIDYLMPVTHGLLLTTSLRSSQHYSKATIIALSSVNDPEVQECFQSHSVSDYLTKPIHKSDIETIVANISGVELQKAS